MDGDSQTVIDQSVATYEAFVAESKAIDLAFIEGKLGDYVQQMLERERKAVGLG